MITMRDYSVYIICNSCYLRRVGFHPLHKLAEQIFPAKLIWISCPAKTSRGVGKLRISPFLDHLSPKLHP